MNKPIRIIAWGNDGRSDDGAALALLAQLNALKIHFGEDLLLEPYHQLGPEIALDIGNARLVIFVDAHVDGEREDFSWERVSPQPAASFDSHHCSPAELLSLCRALDLPTPPCYLLALRAFNCEFGDTLSPTTRRLVERGAIAIEHMLLGAQADHDEDLNLAQVCRSS